MGQVSRMEKYECVMLNWSMNLFNILLWSVWWLCRGGGGGDCVWRVRRYSFDVSID